MDFSEVLGCSFLIFWNHLVVTKLKARRLFSRVRTRICILIKKKIMQLKNEYIEFDKNWLINKNIIMFNIIEKISSVLLETHCRYFFNSNESRNLFLKKRTVVHSFFWVVYILLLESFLSSIFCIALNIGEVRCR